MALFDRLGRRQGGARARSVGQRLEAGRRNGDADDPAARRRNVALKAGIFGVLVLLTLAAFPRGAVYEYTVEEGDVWRDETLIADFAFTVFKDPATLARERREVRQQVPPFFQENTNVQEDMQAARDTLARQLRQIFEMFRADSSAYVDLRSNVALKLSPQQWQLLASDYATRQGGEAATLSGPPLYEQLMQQAWEYAAQMVNQGVLNVPRDSILTDQVIISNEAERRQSTEQMDVLFGINEVDEQARKQFAMLYPEQPELVNIATAIFRAIFQPSLQYHMADTMREWQRQADRISPTRGVVKEGEAIVRAGETITSETLRQLESYARALNERSGDRLVWQRIIGQFLIILATYLIFFLYLFLLRRENFDDNKQVLLISILFALVVGLFAIAVRLPTQWMLAVPVAIVSVLLTVIFDSRVGIFGTLTLALIGGNLLGYDFEFAFATIFAGTLGVFSVRDIKNRGQFFLSAGLVFVGYLTVLGATTLFYSAPSSVLLGDLLQAGINSFLLIIAYPLLWVFERAFGVTTDLTLLELSDTNRPVLKELSLRAPGTFNHSLQVANLAEAAADSIGANALLARVGALYHDIGKMLKPEYFVENQRPGDNPHDQLKPRMSALIIASHVKDGLEMGRQHNLPRRVLVFVPMHHGTTRIEYFYKKALEQAKPEDPPVLEAEFRYPGPRPATKETGILMLADSTEAASRSLSDPTRKRLETLIDMIFKARIEDGQLDDTELTFRELNQIKETFLTMLMGIYHVRVKYPGQEVKNEKPEQKADEPEEVNKTPAVPPDVKKEIRKEGVVGTFEQGIAAEDQAPPEDEAEVEEPGEAALVGQPEDRQQPAPPEVSGDGAALRENVSEEEQPRGEEG